MFGGTVKVRMRFHKFVLCRHCKCAYRLGSARKFVARSSTEKDARRRAEWKAEEDWGDAPTGPCPHCFRVPPELAAKSLASGAGLILFVTGGALGVLLMLKYILTDSEQTPPVEGFGQKASSGRSIGSRVADSMTALSLARRGSTSAVKKVAAATLPV